MTDIQRNKEKLVEVDSMKKWGFLRETRESAIAAGKDADTGLHRTGLDEYLKVIFPDVSDWLHDKQIGLIGGVIYKSRPDYRSESIRTIIEFDGLQHYTKPDVIERDQKNKAVYEALGYHVIRIPYFIQLSNNAVKKLFGIDVVEYLFDESIPSLGVKGNNTPAFLCPAGLQRMAMEFKSFPEQYVVNVEALKQQDTPYLTGIQFLEREFENCST